MEAGEEGVGVGEWREMRIPGGSFTNCARLTLITSAKTAPRGSKQSPSPCVKVLR